VEIRREQVLKWIDHHHEDIVDFLQELVRIPSVNPWFHETPGPSRENDVQAVIAERLKTLGAMVEQWEPDSGKLAKYEGYPGYYAGRDFHGRPNLAATLAGTGRGCGCRSRCNADCAGLDPSNWYRRDPADRS